MYLFGIGVVHVVLLTHVDSMNLITKSDFIHIHRSMPMKLKVMDDALHKHIFWGMSL